MQTEEEEASSLVFMMRDGADGHRCKRKKESEACEKSERERARERLALSMKKNLPLSGQRSFFLCITNEVRIMHLGDSGT